MSHIVESCPLTKLNIGDLSWLHSVDEYAVLGAVSGHRVVHFGTCRFWYSGSRFQYIMVLRWQFLDIIVSSFSIYPFWYIIVTSIYLIETLGLIRMRLECFQRNSSTSYNDDNSRPSLQKIAQLHRCGNIVYMKYLMKDDTW